MGQGNNVEQPSGIRELTEPTTPTVAKLKRLLGTSPGFRDLTTYEIELLRKTKQEIAQIEGKTTAKRDKHQE